MLVNDLLLTLKIAFWAALVSYVAFLVFDIVKLYIKGTYEKKSWLKSLFIKNNLSYLLLSFVMAFSVNAAGLVCIGALTDGAFDGTIPVADINFFEIAIESIENAFKMYGFSYDIISKEITQIPYVRMYIISIIGCTAAVAIIIIRAVFYQWKNDIVIWFKLLAGCDIVVGNGEKALNYIKVNKKSILWVPIDSAKDDFDPDKYNRMGILYYCAPFNAKEISHFLKLLPKKWILWLFGVFRREYHFIIFNENDLNVISISEIFAGLADNKNTFLDILKESFGKKKKEKKEKAATANKKGKSSNSLAVAANNGEHIPDDTVEKEGVKQNTPNSTTAQNTENDSKTGAKHKLTKEEKIKTEVKEKARIRIYVHIEVGNEIEPFAKFDLINHDNKNGLVSVLCDTFNVYSSIANEFCMNTPLIPKIPEEFFEKDKSLKPECSINVVIIGLGKVNNAIFKKVLEQYQFCSYNVKLRRYEAHPLNYYIFDKDNDKLENNALIKRLQSQYYCKGGIPEYKTREEHIKFFGKDKITELPEWDSGLDFRVEKICNLNIYGGKDGDYHTGKANEVIDSLVDKDKSMTLVFVGIDDDLNNYRYAQEIRHCLYNKTNHKNTLIFCNFDEVSSGTLGDYTVKNNNINLYGSKRCLVDRQTLNNSRLARFCVEKNKIYCSGNSIHDDWYSITNYMRESSIAAGMHTGFKLGLLGYKLRIPKKNEKLDNSKIIDDFKNDYNQVIENYVVDGKEYDYTNNFNRSVKSVICYSEHLRWVANYFIIGFDEQQENQFKFSFTIDRREKNKNNDAEKEERTKFVDTLINSFKKDVKLKDWFNKTFLDKNGELKNLTLSYDELSEIDRDKMRKLVSTIDEVSQDDGKKADKKFAFSVRIIWKDEDYRFHGCFRNFYGIDYLHLYYARLYEYFTGKSRVEYLGKISTFKYDTQICDNLETILQYRKHGKVMWLFGVEKEKK